MRVFRRIFLERDDKGHGSEIAKGLQGLSELIVLNNLPLYYVLEPPKVTVSGIGFGAATASRNYNFRPLFHSYQLYLKSGLD